MEKLSEKIKELSKELVLDTLKEYYQNKPINEDKYLNKNIEISKEFKKQSATFITFNKNGKLRGCIGSLIPHRSLFEDIKHNTIAAAIKDYRFKSIEEKELKDITFDISYLSETKEVIYESYEDVKKQINKNNGVILYHNNLSSTYLPQVWDSIPNFDNFIFSLYNKGRRIKEEENNIKKFFNNKEILIKIYEVEKYLNNKIDLTVKFYKELVDTKTREKKIECLLCEHKCRLREGQKGFCGVIENKNNKIHTIVYGYIKPINIDPIEKKPLYHFLPETKTLSFGTNGCNFTCNFCQNHGLSQNKKDLKKEKYYSPNEIVDLSILNNCDSISYTYNEPTIFYEYVRDVAKIAKEKGLYNVMVSNGFMTEEVINDMVGKIDAINIDLKSFTDISYKKLKGKLEIVKRNIELIYKKGILVEVTTLIIPGVNDSEKEILDIANFLKKINPKMIWHLSAFTPNYKLLDVKRTELKILKKAKEIGKKVGLKNVYIGNMKEKNEIKCEECNEIIIKREGFKTTKNLINKNNKTCMKCQKEIKNILLPKIRNLNFLNTFYPSTYKETINFLKINHNILKNTSYKDIKEIPKAIIVPHAGYKYSSLTAQIAYEVAKKNNKKIKKILLIGPSHHEYSNKIHINDFDKNETVFGNIYNNKNNIKKIKIKYKNVIAANFIKKEHSTEVQLPLIKYFFPNSILTELVYGKIEVKELEKIIIDMYDEETLIVISTDLSHFYNEKKAKEKDLKCIEDIINLKTQNIENKECEACGRLGVQAILNIARNSNLKSKILDYRTSNWITNNKNKVVGYLSAIIF